MKIEKSCHSGDELVDPSIGTVLIALVTIPFEAILTTIKKLFHKKEKEGCDYENEESSPTPLELAYGWIVFLIFSSIAFIFAKLWNFKEDFFSRKNKK
jgi:hypothetical protein